MGYLRNHPCLCLQELPSHQTSWGPYQVASLALHLQESTLASKVALVQQGRLRQVAMGPYWRALHWAELEFCLGVVADYSDLRMSFDLRLGRAEDLAGPVDSGEVLADPLELAVVWESRAEAE
jgi:hypothetical protein